MVNGLIDLQRIAAVAVGIAVAGYPPVRGRASRFVHEIPFQHSDLTPLNRCEINQRGAGHYNYNFS